MFVCVYVCAFLCVHECVCACVRALATGTGTVCVCVCVPVCSYHNWHTVTPCACLFVLVLSQTLQSVANPIVDLVGLLSLPFVTLSK